MSRGFLAQQAIQKRRQYGRIGAVTVLTALALILAGCGGGGSSSNGGSAGSGRGTLVVAMADAPPAPEVTAVNVTIDRVEAHVNGEWTPLPMAAPVTLNLLDLARVEAVLGSASLPAGSYTQVRFFPTQTTVTDAAGTHDVTVPSAAQTGIKVNVNYEITPDAVTTVLLDFNVNKSLHRQGNGQYHLQPVIPAVVKTLSGTVTGSVTDGAAPGGGPLPGAVVAAVYEAGDSYPVGTEVNTGVALTDGTFKVWALLPGTYTLRVTFTDPVTSAVRTVTKTGVVVTANQNTDVGALAVP
jgi:hypothetical protein